MIVLLLGSALILLQGAILTRLLHKIAGRIRLMPSIQDVKDAVSQAAATVSMAVSTAITAETAQISAQIQALKDQVAAGTTISQADLDALVASVNGIAPAAVSAIDAISTGDGA